MQKDQYSEIGHLLRIAREERQLTLEQAADQLHIRSRYLHALEQGRFDELPGGITYVKGYLRSYAIFLRLDRKEILRRFEQENALGQKSFYLPQVFSKARDPGQWAIWGGFGVALLLYLFWMAFLRADRVEVAVVEPLPRAEPPTIAVPSNLAVNVACLRTQDVYYPPCQADEASSFYLLPSIDGGTIVLAQQEKETAKSKPVEPEVAPDENEDNETDE